MSVDVDRLLRMTKSELDDLFRASDCGPIPNGRGLGTVIIAPGTFLSPEIAELVNVYAWHGKTFNAKRRVLENRILSLGVSAIVADVYKDASWLDGRECIVLDYSKTSFAFSRVRDEIREIAPRFYLGKVFWNRTRLMDFVLEFPWT